MSGMLDGLKVADLSIVTAGGMSTQLLADFGADVVKIEGTDRPDMYRGGLFGNAGSGSDLGAPPFRAANRNKRGLAVDLKTAEGREVMRRLVAQSDLVVENFRRGAIERLGIGFADLIKMRSNIVLASISSQGATGPNRGFTSFGTTLDALAGIQSVSGYDENTPTWSSGRINYPDQTANIMAPSVMLAAVMAARHDGRPRWVDLSQREIVTSLLGESILTTSLTGVDPQPVGNAGRGTVEWLSRCAGQDRWVAISLLTEEDWGRVAEVVGASLPESSDQQVRAAELRAAADRWALTRDRNEAATELQRAGVAAAPVNSGEELLDDPFLVEKGWWQTVDLADGGTEQQRGFAVQFDEGGPSGPQRRAPHLGEHTSEVLAELGYSDDDVRELHERGVVSSPHFAAVQS